MSEGSLHLIELSIPLRGHFTTARGRFSVRQSILVGIGETDETGWAEAAPYPGVTPDTVADVWEALASDGEPPPTAAAALEAARADQIARRRAMPLWQTIGGSPVPVTASRAIGMVDNTVQAVAAAAAMGYRAVKLKVEPGHAMTVVATVREAFPEIIIGVDANGSFSDDTAEDLLRLDAFGVAYVEQPFPVGATDAHRRLRRDMVAAVALDEAIGSVDDAVAAIEAEAADVLVVKPGRIGLDACRTIHDLAITAGVRVKASGLLETGIGRAHTLAVAALPGAVYSDVARAADFLEADPVRGAPELTSGMMTPSPNSGIGCVPDIEALAPFVVREAVFDR